MNIKKLKTFKFLYDPEDKITPLIISQYDIVHRPGGKHKVFLSKKEARSLYTFLKKELGI